MQEKYNLEKWVWTDEDFEIMGWHDCPVYALRFDDDIYLDIDYIFQWNHPEVSGMSYTFWIAPATLVFEQPTHFKIDIEAPFVNGFEIAEILREKNESGQTIWNIATQEGDIWVGAEKFKQIVRRPPSFQFGQSIGFEERGGISFSVISEMDYIPSLETVKKKRQEHEQYLLAKQKRSLTVELGQLNRAQLGVKEFLIKKREIEQKVTDINNALKDSRFEGYS